MNKRLKDFSEFHAGKKGGSEYGHSHDEAGRKAARGPEPGRNQNDGQAAALGDSAVGERNKKKDKIQGNPDKERNFREKRLLVGL